MQIMGRTASDMDNELADLARIINLCYKKSFETFTLRLRLRYSNLRKHTLGYCC